MIILYPTETVYALGVNVFDDEAMHLLRTLKERDESKPESWLVRNVDDIAQYAMVNEVAEKFAAHFLPGPLTLVLQARSVAKRGVWEKVEMIGFRISSDPIAQKLVKESSAPLTCTSANVSGASPLATPEEILTQFGEGQDLIDRIIDDGPRRGVVTTVIRVVGEDVQILREGAIPAQKFRAMMSNL